jgi:hypothetical protein
MTKMTASQATSMGGRFVDKTYVALRRLKVGDSYRQPGELVPEAADWIDKVRNLMLEQQQIEAVNLVTDDAREAFARQWDQERTARFEASKVAQKTKPDTYQLPPEKTPAPSTTVRCANCKRSYGFDHEVSNDEWWMCVDCGQRQTGEQSRKGTLQLINVKGGSHAVNHNRVPSKYYQYGEPGA